MGYYLFEQEYAKIFPAPKDRSITKPRSVEHDEPDNAEPTGDADE
jgi:hypothetical protein